MVFDALLFLLLTVCSTLAYPNGADQSACTSLLPGHAVSPNTAESPYSLSVEDSLYNLQDRSPIKVSISSTSEFPFLGFMLVAESLTSGKQVGEFVENEGVSHSLCTSVDGAKHALTHSSSSAKQVLTAEWIPPNENVGEIRFYATVVKNYTMFWHRIPSQILNPISQDEESNIMELSHIPNFDLKECGKAKGCFRMPEDCSLGSCEYVATWQKQGNDVVFELAAMTTGYVALGLSTDKKMGEDSGFACYVDGGSVKVQLFYNALHHKNNPFGQNSFISILSGSNTNGTLMCKVRRPIKAFSISGYPVYSLADEYHILIAKGPPVQAPQNIIRPHAMSGKDFPIASSQKTILLDHKMLGPTSNLSAYLRKTHGSLMIAAWCFFASVGIIMPRFYTKAWSNKHACSKDVWFTVHAAFMSMCSIFTAAGFVVIFVEEKGFSQKPTFPQCAHPIAGIIVTCLAIINPLMAICRCKPLSARRPIFNFFHWAVGSSAFILAGLTIGVGTTFFETTKWLLWVIVAWVAVIVTFFIFMDIRRKIFITPTGGANNQSTDFTSVHAMNEIELSSDGRIAKFEDGPLLKKNNEGKFITAIFFLYMLALLGVSIFAIVLIMKGSP